MIFCCSPNRDGTKSEANDGFWRFRRLLTMWYIRVSYQWAKDGGKSLADIDFSVKTG